MSTSALGAMPQIPSTALTTVDNSQDIALKPVGDTPLNGVKEPGLDKLDLLGTPGTVVYINKGFVLSGNQQNPISAERIRYFTLFWPNLSIDLKLSYRAILPLNRDDASSTLYDVDFGNLTNTLSIRPGAGLVVTGPKKIAPRGKLGVELILNGKVTIQVLIPVYKLNNPPNANVFSGDATPFFIEIKISALDAIKVNGSGELPAALTTFQEDSWTFHVNEDLIINIRAETDAIGGENLAQCVMTFWQLSVSRTKPQVILNQYLPRVRDYVIGNGCTLYDRAKAIQEACFPEGGPGQEPDEILGRLVLYGLLRYFLWYLITGHQRLEILRDRYTQLFFLTLAASPYAIFLEAFQDPLIAGFNVYFIN